MEKKISVIIATYERSEFLKESLQSIKNSDINDSIEILIIDQSQNASKLHEMYEKAFPFTKHIYSKNASLPAARNLGVEKCSGEILVFIDDDISIEKDFFSNIKKIVNNNPKYSIFAGQIIQTGIDKWENIDTPFIFNKEDGLTHSNFSLNYNGEIKSSVGGFFIIKRDAFTKIGGMDCRFIGHFQYEDIDFFYRSHKKGFTTYYSDQIRVFHNAQNTGGCHTKNKSEYHLSTIHNRTLFYIRHISIIPPRSYIKSLISITEYLSRMESGRHSFFLILKSILSFCKAYIDLFLGVKK